MAAQVWWVRVGVQLDKQQLTVRPGFEPHACRVPTQRGIYLFSVTVDIIQVRRTCIAASNPAPPRLLPWLPVPVLLLLLTHTAPHAVGVHVPASAFAHVRRESRGG